MDQRDFILIGIDGGATKVSARDVQVDPQKKEFTMGRWNATRSYSELPGFLPDFKPVPVTDQLKERDAGKIRITPEEEQQGAVYVEACALVIEDIARQSGQNKVLFGLGMPGLKTADLRGIEVVANGPRIPDYANMLEKRLKLSGIEYVKPLQRIGSDADYCGIGENYSSEGQFKSVTNAYYLGGGTGVADALKLKGQLVPFDQTKSWMAKTWELKTVEGRSLEQFASVGGMQRLYAEMSGKSVAELNEQGVYPLQIAELALKNESDALKTFELIVKNLADLLYERIVTLYAGWKNLFGFVNPNRPPLSEKHPFMGALLERVILGQRLGELIQSEAGKVILKAPLEERLNMLIQQSPFLDDRAKNHYADPGKILSVSRLREAPALGAGIDAYLMFQK
ncbi:hypothetical protein [Caldithrix abyssi]